MEIISLLIDFIFRIDVHLAQLVQDYGTFVYVVLFAIIFVETGFVVMPFLPGDSLLFVVGALAATGALDLPTVMILLLIAAILDRKSTRLNSSHPSRSRMPSSA